jgi:hypothetical protein
MLVKCPIHFTFLDLAHMLHKKTKKAMERFECKTEEVRKEQDKTEYQELHKV